MKTLFVLALLALALWLVYRRLHPYIETARRVLGFVRDARQFNVEGSATNPPRRAGAASESLVRCANCDTWLPASRALTLRSSASVYCSPACLESAADARRPRSKTAS